MNRLSAKSDLRYAPGSARLIRPLRTGLGVGLIGGIVMCAGVRAPQALPMVLPLFAAVGGIAGIIAATLAGTMRLQFRQNRVLAAIQLDNFLTVFFVALLVFAALPVAAEARDVARRSKCRNHLFQHSGFHTNSILLDDDLNLSRVLSCPVCSQYESTPTIAIFASWYDRAEPKIRDRFIETSTIVLAARKLDELKKGPRERQYREWFEAIEYSARQYKTTRTIR